jgi:hypothetical protein
MDQAEAITAASALLWEGATPEARAQIVKFWENHKQQREAGRVFSSVEELAVDWHEWWGASPEEAERLAPATVRAWLTALQVKMN